MFRRVKHYHKWLRSSINLKTKFSQGSPDSIRLQGPSKGPSSGLLYPVSSVKERNRKGGKCKISWVLQSPVSCTQASPKVEASNRPKQAQHIPTCRKVQNGNTRVHQALSDSRGMGVVYRPIRRLHWGRDAVGNPVCQPIENPFPKQSGLYYVHDNAKTHKYFHTNLLHMLRMVQGRSLNSTQ